MNQGPPHPLRIQSCSLWWVCSQPRAWSCLCSAGILPETGVFSLLLAVQWFRFAGKGILLQWGCLCANVSFRAVWDEQRDWNASQRLWFVSIWGGTRWKHRTEALLHICQCVPDSSVWVGNRFHLGKGMFSALSFESDLVLWSIRIEVVFLMCPMAK